MQKNKNKSKGCWRIIFVILLLWMPTATGQHSRQARSLTIEVPPGYNSRVITNLKKICSEVTGELETKLQLPPPQEINIVVCPDTEALKELVGYQLPSWVLGIAIPSTNTIGINGAKLTLFANNLYAVLKHEVCHLYLAQWERQNKTYFPLWFNEGVCEWVSQRLHLDYREDLLASAVWQKTIPFRQLEHRFPIEAEKATQAYLQSRSLIEYLERTYTSKAIAEIIREFGQWGDLDTALQKVTGKDLETLEKAWLTSITPSWSWFWKLTQIFSLFTLMALGVIWAFILQKRRDRKLIAQWEEEELYEDFRN